MSPVAVSTGAGVEPTVTTSGGTGSAFPTPALGVGSAVASYTLVAIAPLGTPRFSGPPFGIGSQPNGLGPYGSQGINF